MKNAFFDAKAKYQLSGLALSYIGGVLKHARAIAAITNPLVNSYKRLVPGYEAPVNVAWSERNRSPMVRIPARRGMGTRCEVRMPDPSCNPYLAFTVMLAAGLDGIKNKLDAGEPVNQNVFEMSAREKKRLKIDVLPGNLSEALDCLEKDDLLKNALGEHVVDEVHRGQALRVADVHRVRPPLGSGPLPPGVLTSRPPETPARASRPAPFFVRPRFRSRASRVRQRGSPPRPRAGRAREGGRRCRNRQGLRFSS